MHDDDIVQRAFALWRGPVPAGAAGCERFRELYADPVTVNGVPTPVADLVARARMLHGALADLTHHLDDVTVAPGRRAIAFHITGRHVGDLVGPLGTVAATGRAVRVDGLDVFDVDERTATITRLWAQADWLGLHRAVAPVSEV